MCDSLTGIMNSIMLYMNRKVMSGAAPGFSAAETLNMSRINIAA